jgi:hypothetical protein
MEKIFVYCDGCSNQAEMSLGKYVKQVHEFLCRDCLNELYSVGHEDTYSHEANE